MFQFRRFPSYAYLIQRRMTGYCPAGFPHSEIHGSMDICSSPWLIAACRVLHRLSVPRHSPCALSSLTNRKQFSLLSLVNYAGFTKIEIVIVTLHPFGCCSTIKICFPMLAHEPLCCLTSLAYHIVQFSRCRSSSSFEARSQSPICWALRSNSKLLSGGPEWARTTDLTIISRTL